MNKAELLVQASMQHGGRLPIYYRVVVTHENQLKDWFEKMKNGKAMDEAFIVAFKMHKADWFLSYTVCIFADLEKEIPEGAHFEKIKEYLGKNGDDDKEVDHILFTNKGDKVTINDANAMFNEWYGPKPTFMRGIGYWRFYSRFVWHLFRDETFRDWCYDYISA